MITKVTTIIALMLAAAAAAAAQASNNPNYPALVDACLVDWKTCVGTASSGINRKSCQSCTASCGRQEISTPPDGTLCTQLREHCQTYVTSPPPGPSCQSPTCVSYYNRCQKLGALAPECAYCANSCKSCPDLYKRCVGRAPPKVAPGTCPSEACTYYEKQCRNSPGINGRFCGDCQAACIGVEDCKRQFTTCRSLNV